MKKISKIHQNKTVQVILLLFCICILGATLRLYNLNWDQGHYLHPDERLYINASTLSFPKSIGEFFSPSSPLNPKMFYYGSFPLYLYKSVTFLLPWDNLLLTSRLISSVFSIATIPLIYLICCRFFARKIGILAAVIFTFSNGSIQYAHFNTTESTLIFFISLITWLSILFSEQKKYRFIIPIGIAVGFSYATKIVGALFVFQPLLALCLITLHKKNYKKIIISLIMLGCIAVIVGLISAPYQLIDSKQFLKEQEFMQGVTYGKYKVPFTIIYENTTPYLYPFLHVFPFVFGFVSFPLAVLGLLLLSRGFLNHKTRHLPYLFILAFPLLYFLWAGLWYTKFERYYLIILPFLCIWAAYALSQLPKVLTAILVALIIGNGILYMSVYIYPHTRILASQWIYTRAPDNSTISGEHWDDNLPLPLPATQKHFNLLQLTVYEPDTQDKIQTLAKTVAKSDYIVLSSRRVYYSILQNPQKYPYTTRFYHLLFTDKLGFTLIKSFTNYPFFISDDFADESFQSYDHPPVLIFQNQQKKSAQTIGKLIIHGE